MFGALSLYQCYTELFSVLVHVSLEIWCLSSWKGHKPQEVGHIVELCPQTNLMVGVYLAAALFLNNYKAFLNKQC